MGCAIRTSCIISLRADVTISLRWYGIMVAEKRRRRRYRMPSIPPYAGRLMPNARGVFETTLDIGENQVTVRGVILQGMARVGSAWGFAQQSGNADDEP